MVVSSVSPHLIDIGNISLSLICKELGWNCVSNGVRDINLKDHEVLVQHVLGRLGLVVVEVLVEPFPDICWLGIGLVTQSIGKCHSVSVEELVRLEVVSNLCRHLALGVCIGIVAFVAVILENFLKSQGSVILIPHDLIDSCLNNLDQV